MSNNSSTKKVLIIGHTLKNYPRNSVFINAWQKCTEVVVEEIPNNRWRVLRFISKLFFRGWRQNFVLIMQPVSLFIWPTLFFRLFWRGQIVIDAFISVYDTCVYDRQLVNKNSLKALYYYLIDRLTCLIGDIFIFDTLEHRDYFKETFKLSNSKKTLVIPVAVDWPKIEILSGQKAEALPRDKFNILFWGNYIPLQGIEYILESAGLLRSEERIHFTLIGNGQTKNRMLNLAQELSLKNVTFLSSIKYEELFRYASSADLCLGIFGSTDKAKRVIPNKVLEAMASGKVLITGYNQSMSNFFQDGREIIFCQRADGKSLARKIKDVFGQPERFKEFGLRAKENIRKNFSLEHQITIIKDFLR